MAAGVVDVVPESVDFDAPFDDEESDEAEAAADVDSVDAVVDDDFGFPPRLSVL